MEPVIHLSEGIAQHISYSSLARWEEMTLLTVNYSQPISPGLFISDLTLLSAALLLVQESSASAQFEADAPLAKQQRLVALYTSGVWILQHVGSLGWVLKPISMEVRPPDFTRRCLWLPMVTAGWGVTFLATAGRISVNSPTCRLPSSHNRTKDKKPTFLWLRCDPSPLLLHAVVFGIHRVGNKTSHEGFQERFYSALSPIYPHCLARSPLSQQKM